MSRSSVSLEQLDWSCECGSAYALTVPQRGAWLDLECRHCGLVGSVSVRVKGIKPAKAEIKIGAPNE